MIFTFYSYTLQGRREAEGGCRGSAKLHGYYREKSARHIFLHVSFIELLSSWSWDIVGSNDKINCDGKGLASSLDNL